MEVKLSTLVRGGMFFGNLFGVHVAMVASYNNEICALGLALIFLYMCQSGLHIMLALGSLLFVASSGVLENWKRRMRTTAGFRNVNSRRILRSFEVIAWPAGTVGIIDRD